MNKTHENLDVNYRKRRRRRALLWALGITVALLLAIIVSQQLWLWTVVRPDTAADTLAAFRAIDAQLRRVRRLPVYLRSQSPQVAARTERTTTRIESKDAAAGLLHLDQLSADHGDGSLLISVSESLAREVV